MNSQNRGLLHKHFALKNQPFVKKHYRSEKEPGGCAVQSCSFKSYSSLKSGRSEWLLDA